MPRSPDSRLVLLSAPSHPSGQWLHADFVPDYSCGPVAAYTALPLGHMGYRFIGMEKLPLVSASFQSIRSALCFHEDCHKRQHHRSEHHNRETHVADRQRKGGRLE